MTDATELVNAIEAYKAAVQAVEDWEATEGVEYGERRKTVYGRRKAAQRELAQLLQEAGLTSITFGRD